MAYTTVLLDVDGTLVDSNDAHAHAWVRALGEHDRHADFSNVRPLMGMGGDKVLPALTGIDADSAEGKAIGARRRAIFLNDLLPGLRPTRGAQRLLEWLRDEGLELVVASSAQSEELGALLDVAGATKLVDAASSSDDAEESKPDPDIVHAALRKAGCEPGDAVLIGDTPYDIEAGSRAGVGVVALRCGGWWADDALAGALAIYDDPDDLIDHYLLSPFKRPAPLRSA